MNFKKKVAVRMHEYDNPTMIIEIKDKQLKVSADEQIRFIDLCRYLIEKTPILETRYSRTSPYKLRIEKVHDHKGFSHKSYHLDYLEIKDNDTLVEANSHVVDLLGTNMKIQGNLEFFIPDLLLVMQERGYVSLSNDQNGFIPSRKFNTEVKYEEFICLLSPKELEWQGYTVPFSYSNKYKKLSL